MAAPQKAPNRIGEEARLERILGVLEGHHFALLSVRFEGRTLSGGSSEAFNYCRWGHHATDSGTSETGLHLLSKYGLR